MMDEKHWRPLSESAPMGGSIGFLGKRHEGGRWCWLLFEPHTDYWWSVKENYASWTHWAPFPVWVGRGPQESQTCAMENCERDGVALARGRASETSPGHPDVAMYCEAHARIVADEDGPEHAVACPYCGCQFGVN